MSSDEPTDVGPAVGGDMPVSQADIDQVVQLLTLAEADGRLTDSELVSRSQAARDARTFDDLIPLTRDLVSLEGPRQTVVTSDASDTAVDIDSGDPESSGSVVAVMSGATRKGAWVVPAKLSVWTVFGGAELDLSAARFTSDVVEITMTAVFGGVTIIVPEDAQVIDRTSGSLMGGMDIHHPDDVNPDRPTIICKGVTAFGGIWVKPAQGPKP